MNDRDSVLTGRLQREQRERLAREQSADDLRWLMSDERGRRIMHGLLHETGLYRQSYTGNSETFFREGQRAIGLKLLERINTHCPASFVTMLEEQQNDDRESDHRAD